MPYGYGKSQEHYKQGLLNQKGRRGAGAVGNRAGWEDLSKKTKVTPHKDVPSYRKENPWTATPKTPSGNVKGQEAWQVYKGGAVSIPTGREGSFPTHNIIKKVTPTINIPNQDDGGPDDGGTTDNGCTGGQVPDGRGGCKDPETQDQGCGEGQEPDGQGGCRPVTTTQDDDDGTPSLTTITQPDETPDLQALTEDMDLRNMLTNVLNKNNPLFKQAKTRALQAMAARGIVNSSMAEEAVMNAMMNVAMPIATRVIDDMQRVMAANVNASNAFKQAINEMYYKELLSRIDASHQWNLQRMKEKGLDWRSLMEAMAKGSAAASDENQFERYMQQITGGQGWGTRYVPPVA